MEEQKTLKQAATGIKKQEVVYKKYLYLPGDGLTVKVGSVFKLCNLAGKRTAELSGGMPKLVESNVPKTAIVALDEITQGKVTWQANP